MKSTRRSSPTLVSALLTSLLCLPFAAGCDPAAPDPDHQDGGTTEDGGADTSTADAWGPDQRVDADTGFLTEPALAVAADGAVMTAWTARRQGTGGQAVSEVRWSSHGPDEDTWSNAVSLSDGLGLASDPRLGAGGGGFVMVWQQIAEPATRMNQVFAAVHDGNAWGTPELIDSHDNGAGVFQDLRLAVAANGDALAAWTYSPSNVAAPEIRTARMDGATGAWVLADPFPGEPPQIALEPGGRGLILYGPGDLRGRTHTVAGGWSAETVVAEGEPTSFAAAAGDGHLFAVWDSFDAAASRFTVQARALPSGAAAWTTPEAIPTEAMMLLRDVTVGPEGDLLVASAELDSNAIHVSRYAIGTGWEDEKVAGASAPSEVRLAAGPGGDLAVTWVRPTGLFASRLTPAGWNDPAEVNSSGSGGGARLPAIGIDAAGTTTILWSEESDASVHVNRLVP